MTVEALGTSFNVRRTQSGVSVEVFEGVVRIFEADNPSAPIQPNLSDLLESGPLRVSNGEFVLGAGHWLAQFGETGDVEIGQMELTNIAAWRKRALGV